MKQSQVRITTHSYISPSFRHGSWISLTWWIHDVETNAAVAFCPSTLGVRKVSLQARLLKSPNRGTFRVTNSLCSFVSFGTTVRVSSHNDFGRHFVSLLSVFFNFFSPTTNDSPTGGYRGGFSHVLKRRTALLWWLFGESKWLLSSSVS
jgi:hypothetical protein